MSRGGHRNFKRHRTAQDGSRPGPQRAEVRESWRILRKTASKPAKQAKLVAAIKSPLGQSADEQDVHSVLTHLLASGMVVVDSKGRVRYALQAA